MLTWVTVVKGTMLMDCQNLCVASNERGIDPETGCSLNGLCVNIARCIVHVVEDWLKTNTGTNWFVMLESYWTRLKCH